MAIYRFGQYEVRVAYYDVEANSEAEAIANLWDGNHECLNTEAIHTYDEMGLEVEHHTVITEALAHRCSCPEGVIPGIRSIKDLNTSSSREVDQCL